MLDIEIGKSSGILINAHPLTIIYELAGFCFFIGLLYVIPLLGRNHHNPSTGHAE
ncbi:hypothetical protein ACFQI7_22935 [Paenibacillus allorhizosphaerae]|uniref:hypothetical protein n=1 Tax=Paenibacillus allorhizosphaerae TaxID=2849866 RepID=UPI001C40344C|nr:hypothetical protein [Paenibacillus allorhizosphaerae]